MNALTSPGFSTAALLPEPGWATGARCAFTRLLALAMLSVVLVWRPRRDALLATAAVLGLMQPGDAAVGVTIHDVVKTLGRSCSAS